MLFNKKKATKKSGFHGGFIDNTNQYTQLP